MVFLVVFAHRRTRWLVSLARFVAPVGEETSTPVAPSTSRQPAPATRFASFRVDLVLAAQFMAADGANPFA